PREEPTGPEGKQRGGCYCEGPAAGAIGAKKDTGDEERVRVQGEDVVVAHGDIGEIEHGAYLPQQVLRSARGPETERSVVDDLDRGGQRLRKAIHADPH